MPRNSSTGVYSRVVNSFSEPILGEVIDPTDADAFWDDLTDALNDVPAQIVTGSVVDTRAFATIQAAIDYGFTNGILDVCVADASNSITSAIAMRAGIRLFGLEGVSITQPSGTDLAILINCETHSADGCSIEGLIINGARDTNSGNNALIKIGSANDVTVKGCTLTSAAFGNGVWVTTGLNPKIIGCDISDTYSAGVYIVTGVADTETKPLIQDNNFTNCGFHNIVISNANGPQIIDNDLYSDLFTGIVVNTSGSTVTHVSGPDFTDVKSGMALYLNGGSEYIVDTASSSTSFTTGSVIGTLTGVAAAIGSGDGISIDSSSRPIVTGNIVHGSPIVIFNGSGASQAMKGIVVAGNFVENGPGGGIALFAGGGKTLVNPVIINNEIRNVGQAGAAVAANARVGIYLEGGSDLVNPVVDGNTIYDDQASATMTKGILLATAVSTLKRGLNYINGATVSNDSGGVDLPDQARTPVAIIGSNVTSNTDVVLTVNANAAAPAGGASGSGGIVAQIGGADANNAVALIDTFHNTNAGGQSFLTLRRARGTGASPTAVLSGDGLGTIGMVGATGANTYAGSQGAAGGAFISAVATENWSGTNQGTKISVYTTPVTTAAVAQAAQFGASGGFSVGTTTDPGAGIINVLTGFRIGNAATSGNVLRGNGTNFVSATLGIADLSGLGTGVATALAINVGSAGAPVTFNGAGGTPSSITLTNGTGLPTTGLTGTLQAAQEPAHTGDATNTAGSLALTLATVNSNVGTFGSATQAIQVTVNGKGLVTAAANVTVTPAVGSITGLGTGIATALAVNVGTAGAPIVNGGALGSPSSAGTLPAFTLGGAVSGGGNQINNVIIGASTPLAGTFTSITFSPTTGGIVGTTTNDDATAGKVGEYVATQITAGTGTVTISNASPAVITWTGHPYVINSSGVVSTAAINLTTTGGLPTGLSVGTNYYFVPIDANSGHVATTVANALAGTFINTSSAGSGTHTGIAEAIMTSASNIDLGGFALTAGDWDCRGNFGVDPNILTTMSSTRAWINTTSATQPGVSTRVAYTNFSLPYTAGTVQEFPFGPGRFSLSATTNVFFSASVTFATNVLSGFGLANCRRVR